MRGKAMQSVCDRLQEVGVDLSEFSALEFFGREGDWQTIVYADKVKRLEVWEIKPEYFEKLEQNLPNAVIRIGDSFELARHSIPTKDMVVIDNPQGICDGYCEHFEVLPLLPKLLTTPGIVIFNINKNPYGENEEWFKRRKEFYGDMVDIIDFYKKYFKKFGYDTFLAFEEKRNEFLSYLVFGLCE